MSSDPQTIRIGTRRSPLAVKQAELVLAALQTAHPTLTFEIHAMATMGDLNATSPLPNMGKGLWTNELEAKLLARELDFVVHCAKDMPTNLPEGFTLGCVSEREDPRDVVLFRPGAPYKSLADLPPGSVVGTSSLRRSAQLRRNYPSLEFRSVRGGIDTRIAKLDAEDGPFSCIILAAAGLLRMNYNARISQYLDSTTEGGGMLYAVGQGALAIEVRDGDKRILDIVKTVENTKSQLETLAERGVMRTLEGGCSVPIGVESTWVGEGHSKKLHLKAIVISLDGSEVVEGERTETVSTAEEADLMGQRLAQELVGKGAQKILDAINQDREAAAATLSP